MTKSIDMKNLERDICRNNFSWREVCAKYQVAPDEIRTRINRAYRNDKARIRDLLKRLENAENEQAKRERSKKESPVDKKEAASVPIEGISDIKVQEGICRELEAEIERIKEEVASKGSMVDQKLETYNKACDALKKAQAGKERAYAEYLEAKDEKFKLDQILARCKESYKMAKDKLNGLCARPKLVFGESLDGRIEGNVYVSKRDYDSLDGAKKGLVRPVSIEGVSLRKYPDDFYLWPELLGLKRYLSTVDYVLAYLQLRSKPGFENLEIEANDIYVRKLLNAQGVSE